MSEVLEQSRLIRMTRGERVVRRAAAACMCLVEVGPCLRAVSWPEMFERHWRILGGASAEQVVPGVVAYLAHSTAAVSVPLAVLLALISLIRTQLLIPILGCLVTLRVMSGLALLFLTANDPDGFAYETLQDWLPDLAFFSSELATTLCVTVWAAIWRAFFFRPTPGKHSDWLALSFCGAVLFGLAARESLYDLTGVWYSVLHGFPATFRVQLSIAWVGAALVTILLLPFRWLRFPALGATAIVGFFYVWTDSRSMPLMDALARFVDPAIVVVLLIGMLAYCRYRHSLRTMCAYCGYQVEQTRPRPCPECGAPTGGETDRH